MCQGLGGLGDLKPITALGALSLVPSLTAFSFFFFFSPSLSLPHPFLNLAGLQRSTPWKVSDPFRALGWQINLCGVLCEGVSLAASGLPPLPVPKEGCVAILPTASRPSTGSLRRTAGQRAGPSTRPSSEPVCPLACLFLQYGGDRGREWRLPKGPQASEETPFCPAQLRKLSKAMLTGPGVELGAVGG